MKVPAKAIIIAVVVAIALSLPFWGHNWNLFMHLFGAIVFMGNIMVTAAWASLARRDGSPDAVRLASRGIVWADVIFTTPGAVLVFLNGGILGMPYFKQGAGWVFVALGLFVVSVILWLAVLVPAERKLLALSHRGGEVPEEWFAVVKRWFRVGGIATLLILIVLVLMVAKPAIW